MGLPQFLEDDSTRRHTYREYLTWPEEVRVELIEGEVFDMSPAPNRSHQRLSMELSLIIANLLKGAPCEVYAAPFDVRLPEAGEAADQASTVVQPDISVICDPTRLDDAGCVGAPDLVIEILSPWTAAKDQVRKRRLYERHGVREYWLVHPTDRTVRIYRLGADGLFGKDEVFDATMAIHSAVLTDLVVDVGALFAVLG